MLRFSDAPRCILPALSVAFALLAAAALAPPLAAQERGAAAEDDDDDQTVEVADEEDDLLEPSNTGYIDDAIVATKVRLRYDAAYDATKPDRAEFIYGKCSCFNILFGQDAASPGPAEDLDFQELELTYEHAFSDRFSLFFEVPFRSVDLSITPGLAVAQGLTNSFVSNSGLGDVRIGAKYALVAEEDRYVTFQLRGYLATGDAQDSLGTDHETIEPGILFFSRRSERLTIASELRLWYPLSGSSDPISRVTGGIRQELPPDSEAPVRNDGYTGEVLRFGFGVSNEGRAWGVNVSPVVELVGWYVFDGFFFTATEGPQEADGDTIVNLKLGARISDGGPGSFYVGYGFALTDDEWYEGILRLEYRIGLGGG